MDERPFEVEVDTGGRSIELKITLEEIGTSAPRVDAPGSPTSEARLPRPARTSEERIEPPRSTWSAMA